MTSPIKSLSWACAAIALSSAAAGAMAPGFVSLIDDNGLPGWRGCGDYDYRELAESAPADRASLTDKGNRSLTEVNPKTRRPHWRTESGELINDGSGANAATERDYGDFELEVDWKITADFDSGICLRGVSGVKIAAGESGGLGGNAPGSPGTNSLRHAARLIGEWNHFRIVMVGSRVSVWLNGQPVVDHAILENDDDRKLSSERRRPAPPRGPIVLRAHGGETHWRNLFIREIGSDEADRFLAERDANGFQSIFNGHSLAGWAGAVDEVGIRENHNLVWRKGSGTLYWNQPLSDFQARVEVKLPPGGNNGFAIRYPGTGLPLSEGMCEIQILDDHYEQATGEFIDPRQSDGSAYGMVAAFRGYQHPIGDWNFEEITVKGSTLRVELNGTVILDTDLQTVNLATALAHNHKVWPHPGRDRTTGFFGFAGHQDPVEFKNILIRRFGP